MEMFFLCVGASQTANDCLQALLHLPSCSKFIRPVPDSEFFFVDSDSAFQYVGSTVCFFVFQFSTTVTLNYINLLVSNVSSTRRTFKCLSLSTVMRNIRVRESDSVHPAHSLVIIIPTLHRVSFQPHCWLRCHPVSQSQ